MSSSSLPRLSPVAVPVVSFSFLLYSLYSPLSSFFVPLCPSSIWLGGVRKHWVLRLHRFQGRYDSCRCRRTLLHRHPIVQSQTSRALLSRRWGQDRGHPFRK